jgi:hypothetical protein
VTDAARIGAAAGSGRTGVPAAAGTPGGLAAELSGLPQLVSSLEHDGRSGWKTTEFWASITTWLLPILALIWHRDLSSLAVPLAVVAAAAAQAVYTISRSITKKGHATAIASMAAAASLGAPAAAAALAAAPPASVSAPAASSAPLDAPATAPALGGPGTSAITAAPGAAAPLDAPATGAASPGPAGLIGADGARLIQAMTAAVQALTAAVEKRSG